MVDDCSTDVSSRIMCEIRKRDKGVRLLQLSENFGTQVVSDCGIEAARGIPFLDSDAE